jgi:hypothetical protein
MNGSLTEKETCPELQTMNQADQATLQLMSEDGRDMKPDRKYGFDLLVCFS